MYNQITSLANSITNAPDYQQIEFATIDNTLASLQNLKISGNKITRHLAMLLVSEAQEKLENAIPSFEIVASNTYNYLAQLSQDYSDNNDTQPDVAEDYNGEKHFATIKEKLSEDGQILLG